MAMKLWNCLGTSIIFRNRSEKMKNFHQKILLVTIFHKECFEMRTDITPWKLNEKLKNDDIKNKTKKIIRKDLSKNEKGLPWGTFGYKSWIWTYDNPMIEFDLFKWFMRLLKGFLKDQLSDKENRKSFSELCKSSIKKIRAFSKAQFSNWKAFRSFLNFWKL